MNKLHLLHKAERLYCIENLVPEMIAKKLNISRRTVFNWKKEYDWDKKRFEKDIELTITEQEYLVLVIME